MFFPFISTIYGAMYQVIIEIDSENGCCVNFLGKRLEMSVEDALYISRQKNTLSDGKGWNSSFPDIVNHTSSSAVRKDLEFEAAKHGDYNAALSIVNKYLKQDKVDEIQKLYPDSSVVYIHKKDMEGANMIPAAYASRLGDSGLRVDDGIVMVTDAKHTGASDLLRLFKRSRFEGKVIPGRSYVVVDDFITSGAEVRDLKDYIESHGGNVVCVTSFGHGSYGKQKMNSTMEQHQQLRRYGLTDAELRRYGIASSIENLTYTEASKFMVLVKSRSRGKIEEGSPVYQRLLSLQERQKALDVVAEDKIEVVMTNREEQIEESHRMFVRR